MVTKKKLLHKELINVFKRDKNTPNGSKYIVILLWSEKNNYEPGATLLNFSDRADTDEKTPYSVDGMLADCCVLLGAVRRYFADGSWQRNIESILDAQ